MKLHNKICAEELKAQILSSTEKRITLSFYQYANIPNPSTFRDQFYMSLDKIGVLGRVYIASEGINGQLSVPEVQFDVFRIEMNKINFLKDIRLNIAIEDDGKSFYKLKVKVRDKIVADGLDDASFDVTDGGKHLSASEYNELVDSPETVVVDMRNHYESEVGHFKGALTPDVETFRESLLIVEDLLMPHKEKNIVMYCTGGIRCEKASAYFKHKGFKKVHQLEGGIIEYARQVKKQGLENKFQGKNFVFDERLGERITEEIISKCHQCGKSCDDHQNCANDACHILFIQCTECALKYEETCSIKCQDFIKLSPKEKETEILNTQFNGTKFGKGRYKAHRKDHDLSM